MPFGVPFGGDLSHRSDPFSPLTFSPLGKLMANHDGQHDRIENHHACLGVFMSVFLEGLDEQERPWLSRGHEVLGLGPTWKQKESRTHALISLCFAS